MEQSTAGESVFTNGIPLPEEVERRTEVVLHALVGEFLALGFTNEEILVRLQTEQELSPDDARLTLRAVYDSWSSVRDGLNMQAEDDLNWHQFLRMKLLQTAISDPSTPSQRLALQVLDSLADIQGLTTVAEHVVPLSIEIVEKKIEPKPKP